MRLSKQLRKDLFEVADVMCRFTLGYLLTMGILLATMYATSSADSFLFNR